MTARPARAISRRGGLNLSHAPAKRVVRVNLFKKTEEPPPVSPPETNGSSVDTEEITEKLTEYVEVAKAKWEEVEEKPAAIALTFASIIAIWAASNVLDSIDSLPILPGLLELVGLIVTSWFVYRYLIFGPDREELMANIDVFLKKVTGK